MPVFSLFSYYPTTISLYALADGTLENSTVTELNVVYTTDGYTTAFVEESITVVMRSSVPRLCSNVKLVADPSPTGYVYFPNAP